MKGRNDITMKKKDYVTPETYIKNYTELSTLNDFPLVQKACLELQKHFIGICHTKCDNILQQISELLEIDAQLQMYLEFFQHDFFEEGKLVEEDII